MWLSNVVHKAQAQDLNSTVVIEAGNDSSWGTLHSAATCQSLDGM
jgi:hypothetical protein